MKETFLLIFVFYISVAIGQPFTNINTNVIPVDNSSTAWGDYDNDGDLDLAISGFNYTGTSPIRVTSLYNNDGDGALTLVEATNFPGLEEGHLQWADFNQDNLLDLLIIGFDYDMLQRVTLIYQNLGNGNFSLINNTNLIPTSGAATVCEDFDNDGDIDLFISGFGSTCMYFNNGDATFRPVDSFLLVNNTAMASGDFDSDGDLDLIYTGLGGGGYVTYYYKNLGNGTFINDTSSEFIGVNAGSIAVSDYDNDGDLDILISGWEKLIDENTRLYENNGNGIFQQNNTVNFIGLINCDLMWGDYDVDGDMDLLMTGSTNNNNQRHTKIYTNQGGGNFSELINPGLQKVFVGTCDWVDIDNDADLDIFISGRDNSNKDQHSLIYHNENLASNIQPTEPTNLMTIINGDEITISWSRAYDVTTPQASLSYNYYLRKIENDSYSCPPLSNTTNGNRMIIRSGNASLNTSLTIQDLTPGTYHWSVQSIDNGYSGSKFANEQSFSIEKYSGFYVNIYPVPSYNSITIIIQSPVTGDMNIAIYNNIGQQVLNTSYSINQNIEWKQNIQLPKVASGSYNIVIAVNNEVVQHRVIIKR